MSRPTVVSEDMPHETKSGVHKKSWTSIFGLAFLLFLLAAPLFISEAIGGWTRKYTSPVRFSTSSIPDLTSQVAIVTGANTGIGYHTALELARNGAHVILACRSEQKCQAAMSQIKNEVLETTKEEPKLTFLPLDLASLDSVKQFASDFTKLDLPLHILVLNAGVMKSPGAAFVGQSLTYGFETTKDGFEYHIGVNHVAHSYLTKLLLPKLQQSAPARVVVVSSLAEQNSYEQGIVFDQWVPPANGKMPETYEDGNAYGQSKLANLMFAAELALRLNGTGVTAYALHPGVIETELGRYMEPVLEEQMQSTGKVPYFAQKAFANLFSSAMFSAKDGALTQLHLATAPVDTLINGAMYHPIGKVIGALHPQGQNRSLQTLLWEETEKAIEQRNNYRPTTC